MHEVRGIFVFVVNISLDILKLRSLHVQPQQDEGQPKIFYSYSFLQHLHLH